MKILNLVNRLCKFANLKIMWLTPKLKWPEDISRFEYQKQFIHFELKPGDIVLDIGSGAYPFPLATILADRYLDTTQHRTESIVIDSRPFFLSDVERLPFKDKAIDFVYCSHLLEHVEDPIEACKEIVRVGKRGYIETPTFGKDALFAWAKDMHKWHVVAIADKLIFFEYSKRQLEGIRSKEWGKAVFSEYSNSIQFIYYKNPEIFNTMFSWQDCFDCVVYYLNGEHISRKLT